MNTYVAQLKIIFYDLAIPHTHNGWNASCLSYPTPFSHVCQMGTPLSSDFTTKLRLSFEADRIREFLSLRLSEKPDETTA